MREQRTAHERAIEIVCGRTRLGAAVIVPPAVQGISVLAHPGVVTLPVDILMSQENELDRRTSRPESAAKRLRAMAPYVAVALVVPGGIPLLILWWLSRRRPAPARARGR